MDYHTEFTRGRREMARGCGLKIGYPLDEEIFMTENRAALVIQCALRQRIARLASEDMRFLKTCPIRMTLVLEKGEGVIDTLTKQLYHIEAIERVIREFFDNNSQAKLLWPLSRTTIPKEIIDQFRRTIRVNETGRTYTYTNQRTAQTRALIDMRQAARRAQEDLSRESAIQFHLTAEWSRRGGDESEVRQAARVAQRELAIGRRRRGLCESEMRQAIRAAQRFFEEGSSQN